MTFPKTVIVPDCSFWQDNNATPQMIDFAKMKAAGAPGVIIRAGQGAWTDPDFAANWKAAKTAGLLRGSYWYYDSRYTPGYQAGKFADLLKADPPEMEVWADYEENYSGAWAGWQHFAVFLSELQKLLPHARIGIYTGYYYWKDHSPSKLLRPASYTWFAQFSLWLAQYGPEPTLIPGPWTAPLYWQFTAHGNGPQYGTESLNVDLNYFNGSLADFRTRYNVIEPPVIEPVVKITSIRNAAGVVPELLTVGYTINAGVGHLQVVDQRPPVVPPPPVETGAGLYRILDDVEAGIEPDGPRPFVRDGVVGPPTVPLFGGSAYYKIPPKWIAYLANINTWAAMNYLFKPGSGWQNGTEPYVVRTLTFAGNVVEVLRVEGNRAYIKTVSLDDDPPAAIIRPVQGSLHPLIHNFTIQYILTGDAHDPTSTVKLDYTTDGRDARIILLSPPGEQLWIDVRNLRKVVV